MSKLTDRLEADCGDHCRANCVLCLLRSMLPAHEAGIREQAQREQMEADCRVVCIYCRLVGSPTNSRSSGYHHAGFQCVAKSIRAAWAKAHPEDAQQ